MFQRIAIVNRGEAAMRLIHAVRDLNAEHPDADPVTTIALYTDAERSAMFAREADITYDLGPAVERPYINLPLLEKALVATKADAAWVGWGFVAEDAAFADLPATLIKVVRYPGTDEPEPGQGVGAHKDSGVLTLLWVEPGKGGLQVQRGGEWVDAPPVEGAFVVNIGEMLEYATGGYLIATNHRVISPRAPGDRISVPYFFNPALDSRLPLIELPADLAAQARGVTQDPTNPIHALHGENALKSRLRAHPDVAERWHADLLATRA